jgi:hypothetical protein
MKSRKMRGTEYVTCIGEIRNAYKILAGNLKGKELGMPRHR